LNLPALLGQQFTQFHLYPSTLSYEKTGKMSEIISKKG